MVIEADITCAICLEPFTTGNKSTHATTSCNHSFCHSCLAEWLVSHNRCPVCRRNLGDPDDVQEEMDDEENGPVRLCHMVLSFSQHNMFRPNVIDQGRMHDWGAELADGIRQDLWDIRWRRRKDEWTLKLRGMERRHYLIRATVIERDEPKTLPYCIYMEAFLLQEIDPKRSIGGGKHIRQQWQAHTQGNQQTRRRARLIQPLSGNRFRR